MLRLLVIRKTCSFLFARNPVAFVSNQNEVFVGKVDECASRPNGHHHGRVRSPAVCRHVPRRPILLPCCLPDRSANILEPTRTRFQGFSKELRMAWIEAMQLGCASTCPRRNLRFYVSPNLEYRQDLTMNQLSDWLLRKLLLPSMLCAARPSNLGKRTSKTQGISNYQATKFTSHGK